MSVAELYLPSERLPAPWTAAFWAGDASLALQHTMPRLQDIEVYSHCYVLPSGPFGGFTTAVVSTTRHGITPRVIIAASRSGQLVLLERRWLDARRKPRENLTPEEMQEGTAIPYDPMLPLTASAVISGNLTLAGIRFLRTGRAGLESVSHVFCAGTDLFYTHVTPASTFDRLQEDFNYGALLMTVVAVLVGTIVASFYARRAELLRQWL